MPWVRFTADHDFKPRPAVTLAYLAGQVRLVTTPCAQQAIALGRAEACDRPGRDQDGQDAQHRGDEFSG